MNLSAKDWPAWQQVETIADGHRAQGQNPRQRKERTAYVVGRPESATRY